MCGIAGAAWLDPQQGIDAPTLQRMTDVIHHRGPDDSGNYFSDYHQQQAYSDIPGIALGFRRLSIIDVAGGHQPMSNEDGSVWLVFNGEIYNYKLLRQRLEGSGHTFRTSSDSETIIHLYEDLGLECFEHLNGMFAIAIWDSRNRQLVLARDRLGQKPLVYAHDRARFLFGSQIKSLLEIPNFDVSVDPAAIDEYLTYQYVPHPNTIFREIKKVPPGHTVVFADNRVSVQPYWQFKPSREVSMRRVEAESQLRELFLDSVKIRLQSEVPLGAFLSGGVDSSLVVAAMQRESESRIKTFSIGFPVKEYDESEHARKMAEYLDTDHHALEVTPDAIQVLPELAWHYDEPFADSSAIPTWYLSEMTRREVTVALSGDGGDELFLGYPRYRAVALSARLERIPLMRHALSSQLWTRLPSSGRQKSNWRRWQRFCQAFQQAPDRRYLDWISIFREGQRATLYREDFLEKLDDGDPADFVLRAWKRVARRSPVTTAALTDLVTYLPCDLMTKVDVASMAHSLECRQPFLDYRLVELAASLPASYHFNRGGKRLLQSTFSEWLPEWVWKRPKMGFAVPLDHWFRDELREPASDLLLANDAHVQSFLDGSSLQSMWDEHASGRTDHSARLWSLFMLETWLRKWAPSASFA